MPHLAEWGQKSQQLAPRAASIVALSGSPCRGPQGIQHQTECCRGSLPPRWQSRGNNREPCRVAAVPIWLRKKRHAPQKPVSSVTISQAWLSGSPQGHGSDHTQENPKYKASIRFSSSFTVLSGQKQFTNQGSSSEAHNQIPFHVSIQSYRVRELMGRGLLQQGKGFCQQCHSQSRISCGIVRI